MLPTLVRAVPWNMFTFLPTTKHQHLPLDQCIMYCMKQAYPRHRTFFFFFATRNRQEYFCRRHKKMKHFGCHSRYFQGVELLHAWSSSELLCAVLLWHCNFSHHQWWELWMGQGHVICPSTFEEFLNVNKPLLLLVISWQVLTAQASAACIW